MRSVRRKPQQQIAQIVSLPAPYKGRNDVAPLSAMPPEYAIVLDNCVATPQGPTLRLGNKRTVTGFDTPVTSLLRFNGRVPADNKLFAVSGDQVFDVTVAAEIDPDEDAIAGLGELSDTNVYWEYTQQTYTTANANYLIAVNGVDMPLLYNGSWVVAEQVVSPSAPGEFAMADSAGGTINIGNFCDVHLHQQRVWFVANNSTKAYYLEIGQVGGDLHPFDFGQLFPRGGALWKLATWTMDAGGDSGVQAVLVAISTKGDFVIFQGNDPSAAETWRYIATYQLGAPVGRRCTLNFEGDLYVFTVDGCWPFSRYIEKGRADPTLALTYPISNSIASLVQLYGALPGFELCAHPSQNVLILNTPIGEQHVMHTITRGWTRFTGWDVKTLCVFNESLFAGSLDAVFQALSGGADNADANGAGGDNIVANCLQAFNTFPQEIGDGVTKTVVSLKPYLTAGGSTSSSIAVGVNIDFEMDQLVVGSGTPLPAPGALFDGATFDSEATFVGGTNTFSDWFSPSSKPGNAIAVALRVSARTTVTWSKTSLRIIPSIEY